MLKGVPAFPLRSFLRRRSMGDCTADLLVWLPLFGGDFLDGCETFFAVFKANFWTLFETHFSFFFFFTHFPFFLVGGGVSFSTFCYFPETEKAIIFLHADIASRVPSCHIRPFSAWEIRKLHLVRAAICLRPTHSCPGNPSAFLNTAQNTGAHVRFRPGVFPSESCNLHGNRCTRAL